MRIVIFVRAYVPQYFISNPSKCTQIGTCSTITLFISTSGVHPFTTIGFRSKIALWASKDDDEVIRQYLNGMNEIVKGDPNEFINHKKGLLDGFSRRIKPWVVKGYAQRQG
ncbi:hypothetical protein P3L10_011954 [Capsicum annuum]